MAKQPKRGVAAVEQERHDKTIKGGRSMMPDGTLVNAWGTPIDEDGNEIERADPRDDLGEEEEL